MKKKILRALEWSGALLLAVLLVGYLPMLAGALVCAYWASRVQGGAYIRTTAAFVAGWIFAFFSLNFLEICVLMTLAPIREILSDWKTEMKKAKEAALAATLASELGCVHQTA